MIFISRKKLHERDQKFYETGLNKGYELGWQMRQVDRDNRGFIIAGSKLDQELEDILRKEK